MDTAGTLRRRRSSATLAGWAGQWSCAGAFSLSFCCHAGCVECRLTRSARQGGTGRRGWRLSATLFFCIELRLDCLADDEQGTRNSAVYSYRTWGGAESEGCMIITCLYCRVALDIGGKQIGGRVHHARCNHWSRHRMFDQQCAASTREYTPIFGKRDSGCIST
jgi:hypothetical protein